MDRAHFRMVRWRREDEPHREAHHLVHRPSSSSLRSRSPPLLSSPSSFTLSVVPICNDARPHSVVGRLCERPSWRATSCVEWRRVRSNHPFHHHPSTIHHPPSSIPRRHIIHSHPHILSTFKPSTHHGATQARRASFMGGRPRRGTRRVVHPQGKEGEVTPATTRRDLA
jgi:hypothetical protein